jgi:hypothetical protein
MDERKYIRIVSKFIKGMVMQQEELDDYELRYVCRHSARKLYKISKGFHSNSYTHSLLHLHPYIITMYINAVRK